MDKTRRPIPHQLTSSTLKHLDTIKYRIVMEPANKIYKANAIGGKWKGAELTFVEVPFHSYLGVDLRKYDMWDQPSIDNKYDVGTDFEKSLQRKRLS